MEVVTNWFFFGQRIHILINHCYLRGNRTSFSLHLNGFFGMREIVDNNRGSRKLLNLIIYHFGIGGYDNIGSTCIQISMYHL